MRQSIAQRLNGVVYGKVKELAINQPFETDVTAVFAPQFDQQGNVVKIAAHHWLITVAIPNPLAGNVAIAVSLPIMGVLPPDHIFEQIAERLFDSCMKQKRAALAPPDAKPEPAVPPKTIPGEVVESKTEPPKPKVVRERESHFPSRPGSGDLSAEAD